MRHFKLDWTLVFHGELLARFGSLDGIREEGLLESALSRPLQLFYCGKPSIFDLAASYAEGIIPESVR